MPSKHIAEPDRYVVIVVDRTSGEPTVHRGYHGEPGADRAHARAEAETDESRVAFVVGMRTHAGTAT